MLHNTIDKNIQEQGIYCVFSISLVVLAENGRLSMLPKVIDTFEQIMISHRGEVSCSVTTAKPLDRATERELTSALEAFLEPGQKLNLSLKVCPFVFLQLSSRFVCKLNVNVPWFSHKLSCACNWSDPLYSNPLNTGLNTYYSSVYARNRLKFITFK